MPTKASKGRKPRQEDVKALAARLVAAITGEKPTPGQDTRQLIGRAFGMLGAAKGGKARAAKLSPKERKAIAKKAAATRWSKG